MTYLDPQAGGGSTIINLGIEDLTGINTIDYEELPEEGSIKGFRVDYWDVNMNGNAQDPTVRPYAGGGLPVVAGYDNWCVEMEQAAFNHIITVDTTRARLDGSSGLGLYNAFFVGALVDPATNIWTINGQLYDTFDDSIAFSFCEVGLGNPLSGFRLQTANVSSMTAGFLACQYWT